MDRQIEGFYKTCIACAAVARDSLPEELTRTRLPEKPWDSIAMDFLNVTEHGVNLLVVVDYYSRYIWVKVMTNTDAGRVIEALEDLFELWGYCGDTRTDNGPPFNSKELAAYFKSKNISNDRTTPYTPQQNGEVERQNSGIDRALRIAKVLREPGKTWKLGGST